ncbi:MAG: DsbA family protein [Alphaproteobacteria bacterium]|nr:DsbA family protein [Alphaproteobacteria bacterium]
MLLFASTMGPAGVRARAATPADQAGAAREMTLGSTDAPITVIEYMSLTCPHCARFHAETMPHLLKSYVEAGKVRLVLRDYPLDGAALQGAIVARCISAESPERYFGFVQLLFDRQTQWAGARDPMAELARLSRIAGVGPDQFQACLQNQSIAEHILKERQAAERDFRVRSTPTFVVQGRVIPGFMTVAELDEVLNPGRAETAKGPSGEKSWFRRILDRLFG